MKDRHWGHLDQNQDTRFPAIEQKAGECHRGGEMSRVYGYTTNVGFRPRSGKPHHLSGETLGWRINHKREAFKTGVAVHLGVES